jgi:hypothetical protein
MSKSFSTFLMWVGIVTSTITVSVTCTWVVFQYFSRKEKVDETQSLKISEMEKVVVLIPEVKKGLDSICFHQKQLSDKQDKIYTNQELYNEAFKKHIRDTEKDAKRMFEIINALPDLAGKKSPLETFYHYQTVTLNN